MEALRTLDRVERTWIDVARPAQHTWLEVVDDGGGLRALVGRVRVDWLADVWARRLATVDGHLVLSATLAPDGDAEAVVLPPAALDRGGGPEQARARRSDLTWHLL